MTKRVLVTDCWTRKALSVVRSLGEEGLIVHTVSHTRLGAALYSKYSHRDYIFASPHKDPVTYWEQLAQLLSTENFDCIFPLEEESIEVLFNHKDEVARWTKSPYQDRQNYNSASDKFQVYKLAEKLNIPVPQSANPKDVVQAKEIAKTIGLPLLFKPKIGRGSIGIVRVESVDALENFCSAHSNDISEYLQQQMIPQEGQGLGVACLMENGETLTSFSYKRLREFPISGGPSTLRESTDDNITKEYAEKILKELNWTGVAMVEFKFDNKENQPKLLEINPRFWGSLELAHSAGINFPFLLYHLMVGEEIPKQKYKIGERCRWLFPGDMVHFLSNKKRFSLSPSFFNFFDRNTSYDQLSWSDLPGTFATIIGTILSAFSSSTWRKGIFRK